MSFLIKETHTSNKISFSSHTREQKLKCLMIPPSWGGWRKTCTLTTAQNS